MSILSLQEWLAVNEMTARRSFARSLGKFLPQVVDKPVAILTAWRGERLDPNGWPYPEPLRRKLNDEANLKLAANIRRRGLSYYPLAGAGQEEKDGQVKVNKENSLVASRWAG